MSRSTAPIAGLTLAALFLTGGLLGGSDAVVRSVRAVGPYLEVRLAGDTDASVLLPTLPACAAIARPEASVQWVKRGFPGRIEAGETSCEAAGILDLAYWRDRRPRPDGRLLPRKTARWKLIHRDGRRALLRGRFELAGLIGMAGGQDLVAVIADDEACAPLLAVEEGVLEYRVSGRIAYRLIGGGARCEVRGFARPPAVTQRP